MTLHATAVAVPIIGAISSTDEARPWLAARSHVVHQRDSIHNRDEHG